MKKVILLAFVVLAFANGYSQKEGKFRAGLDLGYVPTGGGGGVLLSLEPKINLTDNMNVGLRLGIAAIAKDIQTDAMDNTSAKVSVSSSLLGTYDYYFHKSGNSFTPYLGAGAGYYSLANVELDTNTTSEELQPSVSGLFGGLLRAGFEWGGFRMGVEYNLIPDSDLENIAGNKKGTAKNSYMGISIGFFVGGGKWSK